MSHCLNPVCNHINPDSAKFCQKCGSQLLVNDRYRAQRVIGQGGFGKTFLAIDEGKPSHPKCVIKQFTYNDPNSLTEAMRLFDQEAKRLDDLGKHPQIPELLGYAKLEDRQYLVQEFIDGQNLEREQADVGPFTEAKLKALLEDLLEVLHFVHGKNVIHRDIKPENIIRRQSDGKAVLVDFGAAKFATATVLAKTGTVIGSPLYVAPEQTRGKAIPASDLYSLGVTCLYLLTQISPFDLKDLDDEWVWRDFLGKNTVSDGFAKFLDKLVTAKPSQRYSSAAEALRDLNPSRSVAPSLTTGSAIQSSAAQIVPTPLVTPISHKSFVEDAGRGLRLEMIAILAGQFLMGAGVDEESAAVDEYPSHRVDVPALFMSKHPITQSQYQLLGLGSPSKFSGKTRPVEQVSWHEAKNFCQHLSQLSGKPYRLPSEAEWEYACRAGSQTPYYFGNDPHQLKDYAWYRENSGSQTQPVGQKKPNGFGLYDMHGNVWEWCEDVWHGNYNGAPTDGKAWLRGGNSSARSLRGSSWNYDAQYCRSARRNCLNADLRGSNFGFRVVGSVVRA